MEMLFFCMEVKFTYHTMVFHLDLEGYNILWKIKKNQVF